jgi:hypothetical protein
MRFVFICRYRYVMEVGFEDVRSKDEGYELQSNMLIKIVKDEHGASYVAKQHLLCKVLFPSKKSSPPLVLRDCPIHSLTATEKPEESVCSFSRNILCMIAASVPEQAGYGTTCAAAALVNSRQGGPGWTATESSDPCAVSPNPQRRWQLEP